MRIAFSGTHRVGKSTLIEAIAQRRPDYRVIDEPYAQLEDDGYEFSDPPTVEDFEAQLRACLERDIPRNALVDRCPLDFIAYLRVLDPDYEPDLDALRDALAVYDLVALVPIETPDRIALSSSEDRRFRARVDEQMRALIFDDILGLDVGGIEVTGSLDLRVEQLIAVLL